jgi:hypothetical protein
MSLKAFHVFFVAVCIVFSAWFGSWCLDTEPSRHLQLVGGASLGLSTSLVAYLFWVAKKLTHVGVTLLLVGLGSWSPPAHACAVCFGDASSPLVQGSNLAILFLLGTVGGLIAAVGLVVGSWIGRARRLGQPF